MKFPLLPGGEDRVYGGGVVDNRLLRYARNDRNYCATVPRTGDNRAGMSKLVVRGLIHVYECVITRDPSADGD